jgi:hypothetical protein
VRRGERWDEAGGQLSNEYELPGLIERLDELAAEELAARVARRSEDAVRRTRRRPRRRVGEG